MKRRESKPPWRRFLIPVLLLLGANLVLLASYTGPRLAEERHSAERLATLRERVEEQRARTETLRERAEATRANAAQLARFYADVVCPDDAARFALVESLEGELRGAGVRAESRRWSSEPAEGLPLERVSGTLPSRGTYGQLTELLGRLERSPEFLIVEEVRLQGREGEAASLDVAVATYCRKREAGK